MWHRLKIQPQMLVRPVSGHKERNTWPILNVWLLLLCFYFKTDHTHTRWWVALGKQKLDESTQCRARSTVLFSIILWSAGSSTVLTGEKRAAEWGQRALVVLALEWKLAGMNFFHATSLPKHRRHEHCCGDGSNCHEDTRRKLPKCLSVWVSLGSLIV